MNKRTFKWILFILVVGFISRTQYVFGPGGSGKMAELSVDGGGEVMLTQDWRGWIDPKGYEVELWYRPNSEGLWGVNVIDNWDGHRWRNPTLDFMSETGQVQVTDDSEKEWTFDINEIAESYVDQGFLYDPEWQPIL